MFEELWGRKVKIVYEDDGKTKAVYGKLLGDNDNEFKMQFNDGSILGVSKLVYRRITEVKEDG